ncbi:MAG: DNA polymerase III subunit chi [Pseudomonadota bacterium]|nr:DNA polymerase III subunit chi [Pseudomonadota bacterium]
MVEISFYHLSSSSLDKALKLLLQKSLFSGKRSVVLFSTEERLEVVSTLLWTTDPEGWLPHGSSKDGHKEKQPIWLTTKIENPNGAEYLFITDGAFPEKMGGFKRCFDLFDGNDQVSVQNARKRWKKLVAKDHVLTYWQQDLKGTWGQISMT